MWAHLINFAIGIWLMFTPAKLNLEHDPATRLYILAPILAAFGLIACSEVTRGARWIAFAGGIYLLLDPWIWGDWKTDFRAAGNALICGAALAIFSLVKGNAKKRFGGGWKAIWNTQTR